MWKILALVSLAGAIGGLLNAVMDRDGLALPLLKDVAGSRVVIPGFVGTIAVGAIAALVSYGLYGPFASLTILNSGSEPAVTTTASTATPGLTLAAFAGAILVGYSGGSWMSAESKKALAQGTSNVLADVVNSSVPAARSAPATRDVATGPNPGEVQTLLSDIRNQTPARSYERALELRRMLAGH